MAQPTLAAQSPNTPDEIREHNARILNDLWEIGEKMVAQAFELRGAAADPLAVILNGFPDHPAFFPPAKGGR